MKMQMYETAKPKKPWLTNGGRSRRKTSSRDKKLGQYLDSEG